MAGSGGHGARHRSSSNGATAVAGCWLYRSSHLMRPAPMALQVFRPAAAAVGGAHLSVALRGGPQLSTLQATAAAVERVTRRKGYASAAGPHPCARVGGVFCRRRGLWHQDLDCEAACPRLRWPRSPVGSRWWPLACWSPPVWPSAAGCLACAIAQPCQS